VFLTQHAKARVRQRGITERLASIIYEEADCERPCGGGCTALELSERRVRELRPSYGSAVERARGVILVVSGGDGAVLTALRAAKARRYRGRK
jgi:hypothetical protein